MVETYLGVGDFMDVIRPALIDAIKSRIREEVAPLVDKIYEEEVAKYTVNLSRFISVERFGHELRITIHKDFSKEAPQ